jgi:hypothetical protein
LAIFNKRMVRITRIVAAVAIFAVTMPAATDAESLSGKVDRFAGSVDDIESKVQSTLVSGGSSPVSFSGEARLKAQYHDLGFGAPGYMQHDRSYLQSGWEGNDNLFRLGMVARAGRNTVLWSKIGFQHTLTGNRYYDPSGAGLDGFTPYDYRHDKGMNSISIHEDMCAGIAVRTVPASFWVKLGNTLWTEASPFTVWKAQPRTFAWEYLPFEVEQPIARYYEYNIAKGEKSGRAAWNKRPFNGINVESINLPAELYANFVYGTFERYDNFEREYVDFAGDLGYADGATSPFPEKGHGVGDSYRHVLHGRLAKGKMFGDMTLGLNYVGINYKDDVLYASKMDAGSPVYMLLKEFGYNDSVFYKEFWTASVDLRGPIGDKFTIHADVAVNRVDTTWWVDTSAGRTGLASHTLPEYFTKQEPSSGDIVPAAYVKLGYNGALPVEADVVYVGKGFYSPFSFAVPMDAFFAYGANMLGAGKFMARGEGSPYAQNMTGANLTFAPKLPGYGHLKLKYGQHFNVEEGRDVVFFPYRLNGSDMFSFFHGSYNRWGNGLIDNSVKPAVAGGINYKGRLGDESFQIYTSYNNTLGFPPVAGPSAGGLRSDYLSMFEGFVPYETAEDAYNNFVVKRNSTRTIDVNGGNYNPSVTSVTNQSFNKYYYYRDTVITDSDGNKSTVSVKDSLEKTTTTSWVPESRKYTFNLELDAAYDIGALLGYRKDLFVGGYAGINGVSKSVTALAFSDNADNVLLWSFYLRLEPAIALNKSFYLLGLFGYENWRSQKAWMMVSRDGNGNISGIYNPIQRTMGATPVAKPENFVKVPIDYRDFAYGIGFDWDMLERVGLHGRVKWITHEDKGLNDFYDANKASLTDYIYKDAKGNIKDSERNDWSTPVFSLEIKTWF